MRATHYDSEKRYSILRNAALEISQEEIGNLTGNRNIRLTSINDAALNASQHWDTSKVRIKDWDWFNGYRAFKFRHPKRFELAMWELDKLIALSMGRPTSQGGGVRLDIVEGAPVDLVERPPVMRMVLLCYGIYARLIDAKEIRIMNPVNDKVKEYYKSFGYVYVTKGDYLYRSIYG